MLLGNPAPFFNNHAAIRILDVKGGGFTAQARRHQLHREAVFLDVEDAGVEKLIKNLFSRHAQRTQQHRSRQLTAAVDTHKHVVFGIELEVEPGATIGNDASRIEQLAR